MGKLLDDYLLLNKQSQDTIPKGLYDKLLKVEAEIIHRQEMVENAYQSIKSNSINIKVISEATNISRKTFYNNELLSGFVASNSANNGSVKEELKKSKEQLHESESKVKKLVERDIDVEALKHVIANLEKELETANQRVMALERQLEKYIQRSDDIYKNTKFLT